MRYKIECFFHNTFYIYNKEDLFNFIDIYTRRNSFFNVFSDRFEKSHISGFFVRKIKDKTTVYNNSYYSDLKDEYISDCRYYNDSLNEYVDSLFIIKDEKDYVINYGKLLDEYHQSRNIKPYKRSSRFYDRSTAAYRRYSGNAKFYESKHTYRKEYSLMWQDKQDGLKVRAKRMSLVKSALVHYYDDLGVRKDDKSWKSNKIKRQWQKKHR